MYRLAMILVALLAAGPVHAVTTPAKKTSKKTPVHKKRSHVPVVHVSPVVRGAALRAISERTSQAASVLEGAGALVPFFEQLSHPPEMSLHILQYGDSHTASDDWVNQLRQEFQTKFGAGGPGYTLPGHPFLGYRRFDSHGSNSRGWHTGGIVTRKGDGIDGLAGISLTAQSAGETVTLTVACEQLGLHYLRQPGGGQIEFSVDGLPVATVDTDGESGAGTYQYAATPGAHLYTARTLSAAPVRLFGWVAQNQAGVTYETFGINGAQANLMLEWDASIFASELTNRDPALVVLAYGTNEALSHTWTVEEYRAALTEIIHRLRAAAPVTSILLIGPPDCEYRFARPSGSISASGSGDRYPASSGTRERLRILGLARRDGWTRVCAPMGAGRPRTRRLHASHRRRLSHDRQHAVRRADVAIRTLYSDPCRRKSASIKWTTESVSSPSCGRFQTKPRGPMRMNPCSIPGSWIRSRCPTWWANWSASLASKFPIPIYIPVNSNPSRASRVTSRAGCKRWRRSRHSEPICRRAWSPTASLPRA